MDLKFKTFTGGIFETNCYLLECPGGNLLVDAPEGADEEFASHSIAALFLTHGHFDHVVDAAKIARRHGAKILFHPDTTDLVSTADAFRKYGFALEIEPFQADQIVDETKGLEILGAKFDLLHVPGHCPGSLCLLPENSGHLFAGDTLFSGSIGRSDLPGGDGELLVSMIREKLLTLPDSTHVHPGHGPSTTIGREKSGNPFL